MKRYIAVLHTRPGPSRLSHGTGAGLVVVVVTVFVVVPSALVTVVVVVVVVVGMTEAWSEQLFARGRAAKRAPGVDGVGQ